MTDSTSTGVLLDTSVWVRFLRPQGYEALKTEVQRVVAAGSAFTCWVVKAELLAGAKDDGAFDHLLSGLQALGEVAITPALWREASRLGYHLRRQGLLLPLPDLLIAQCAISAGLELWHADQHFEHIQQAAPFRARSFLLIRDGGR